MEILVVILCAVAVMAVVISQAVQCEKLKDENHTLRAENTTLKIKVERRDVYIDRLREMKHLPPVKEGEVDAED